MSSESSILNNPYWIYPNAPCAGYTHFDKYNEELKNLNDEILILRTSNMKKLFTLIIGDPIGEYLEHESSDTKIEFQWEQLFPYYIQQYVKSDPIRNEAVLFIVCPNKTYSPEEFKLPLFFKYTDEYKWVNTSKNTYESSVYKCKIILFYTMIPSIDKQYDKKYEKIVRTFGKVCDTELINSYRRTEYDVKFVNEFYDNLKKSIDHINYYGGISTCLSYAVFRHDGDFSHMRNYTMFEEIKECFKGHNLLAEWVFIMQNYVIIPTNVQKSVTYMNPATIKNMCASSSKDIYSIIVKDTGILTMSILVIGTTIKSEVKECNNKKRKYEEMKPIYGDTISEIYMKKDMYEKNIERLNERIGNKYVTIDDLNEMVGEKKLRKMICYAIVNFIDKKFSRNYILDLPWIKKKDFGNNKKIAFYYDVMQWSKCEIDKTFGNSSDVCKIDDLELMALSMMTNNKIYDDK